MQRRHQHVGDTFVALMLKMMLGHPERVVTQPIHQLRHRLRLVEDSGEMLVGIAPVIYRDAAIADIFDIDVPGEQTVEFCNHAMTSTGEPPIDFRPIVRRGSGLATRIAWLTGSAPTL